MNNHSKEEITGEIQQVPSVPQISQDCQLTEADIFGMKNLALNKSNFASELQSAVSVADSASNFDDHLPDNVSNGSGDSVGMQMKKSAEDKADNSLMYDDDDVPSITQPPEMQLTEEDMLDMKKMTNEKNMLGSEMQSAISVADSASNFDEHVQDSTTDNFAYDDEIEEKNSERFIHISANGQFAFNRYRVSNPDLPKDVVTVLPFSRSWKYQLPGNSEEYSAALEASKLYLVGTAHFSQKSQNDVERVIKLTQPDIVFIELCPSRISILSMETETILREASGFTTDRIMAMIRQNGISQALLHVLLLQTSAYITKQLGMAPGGEFRAAHREGLKVPKCRIMLGDRAINVTFQRALAALGFYQKMRLFYHLLMSNWSKITPEDVEKCKQRDLLEEVLREMAGEFPQLSEIFVKERDHYMSNVIRNVIIKTTIDKYLAAKESGAAFQPINMVAVVGIGHVPGITENWDNPDIPSIEELLIIPPPSIGSRIISTTVRCVIYGTIAYGIYRIGSYTFSKVRIA